MASVKAKTKSNPTIKTWDQKSTYAKIAANRNSFIREEGKKKRPKVQMKSAHAMTHAGAGQGGSKAGHETAKKEGISRPWRRSEFLKYKNTLTQRNSQHQPNDRTHQNANTSRGGIAIGIRGGYSEWPSNPYLPHKQEAASQLAAPAASVSAEVPAKSNTRNTWPLRTLVTCRMSPSSYAEPEAKGARESASGPLLNHH